MLIRLYDAHVYVHVWRKVSLFEFEESYEYDWCVYTDLCWVATTRTVRVWAFTDHDCWRNAVETLTKSFTRSHSVLSTEASCIC